MSLNPFTPSIDGPRLHPVEPRHAILFCFALLTVSCTLASFALACATPFAAFAVIAASMLPRRPALLVVTGAWLVNQGIGFCALRYPIDASTLAWGFAIGAAALAATVTSSVVLRATSANNVALSLVLALTSAYAIYEVVLLAVTPFLGGSEAFSLAIVSRLGVLNVGWLVGLVATCEIARLLHTSVRKHAH